MSLPSRIPAALAALTLAMGPAACKRKQARHDVAAPSPSAVAAAEATLSTPEVVALPPELARVAARSEEILARFDTAAKAQGGEGWPELPADLASRLSDPAQTQLFANPRALILMGPEPGRLDALVLVKQVQPEDPNEPYLPVLVRHLESHPVLYHPWGDSNLTPWGTAVTAGDDEIWGWVESKSQNHFGGLFHGLMVVRNEPGSLWLAPKETDEIATWLYGFQNRLAFQVDDLEDAAGKMEHTADEDIGEGISSLTRVDFDRAKDLGVIWTQHVFEVDGRLYSTLQKNWALWKQGPPTTPPKPSSAEDPRP